MHRILDPYDHPRWPLFKGLQGLAVSWWNNTSMTGTVKTYVTGGLGAGGSVDAHFDGTTAPVAGLGVGDLEGSVR
ncbi:hypothetical protein [Lentzea sp. E54]|uniref:hypothetical protein n=1 Tax=Lentzea xerophila TaxID=3435883 RepID=UPI003DA2947F